MSDYMLNFVKPELIVLIPALYFIGIMFKNSKTINNKHIPIILAAIGVLLSLMWIVSTLDNFSISNIFNSIFVSIVQGVIVAGLSVYANQIIKQYKKKR